MEVFIYMLGVLTGFIIAMICDGNPPRFRF